MSQGSGRDYRETLNLPKTAFPMKADLPAREPDRVAWWREHRTYARRLAANAAAEPWILHDGPPYANGDLHMGHFLNMVLKDAFVKIALLDGRRATFVPGWDMHGLPIELETLKHLGIKDFHAIDPLELREKCKERALYWLDRQRDARLRMGAFGEFDAPYRTIDPSFEATIVETLADLAEKQQVYKGLRSTLWCVHDETALAEAEIEYQDDTSTSIYVRFQATSQQRDNLLSVILSEAPEGREVEGQPLPSGALSEAPEGREMSAATPLPVSVLIWTTTPWSLPGNVAIALSADASYGLYRVGDELLILATALAEKALGDAFVSAQLLGTAAGKELDGLAVRHPFLDRDSVIVTADYVELESGTGAVHTAPGHGADDFDTAMKRDLAILNPVDAAGKFTSEAGPYAGQHIWKATKTIVDDLQKSGALWRAEPYEHSYPHCWRCHNPVIFRATAQWFIAMDRNDLREKSIAAADGVAYTPEWGRTRLRQMLENHPEWCISRQRTWGTPIPAIVCVACGDSLLDPRVARQAAARFRVAGASAWWSDPIETFVPAGVACPRCGGTSFEKEKNIVDIWFESGVTHLAVLGKDGLPWPSDVVLEGGDQYRGWFRSSLVTAVAVKGRAPYKRIVKNGWVNDEEGRPMSKSRGTGISASDAMNRWGADVLRLWGASVEFVDDVRFGPNVVTQVGNVYRNVRNRIRYMLSNLSDLVPGDVVPYDAMEPIDKLAVDATDRWARAMRESYTTFEIHDAYLMLLAFEGGDLSSFYFDGLKDRLYSCGRASRERRSAQSALLHVLERFLVAVAPILSFTAEEAWQFLPEELRGERESVFDLSFGVGARVERADDGTWALLKSLREKVASNGAHRDFEGRAEIDAGPAHYAALSALGDNLREALIVSQVALRAAPDEDTLDVRVTAAAGQKCRRCWKYRELGTDAMHPDICSDCAAIVGDA